MWPLFVLTRHLYLSGTRYMGVLVVKNRLLKRHVLHWDCTMCSKSIDKCLEDLRDRINRKEKKRKSSLWSLITFTSHPYLRNLKWHSLWWDNSLSPIQLSQFVYGVGSGHHRTIFLSGMPSSYSDCVCGHISFEFWCCGFSQHMRYHWYTGFQLMPYIFVILIGQQFPYQAQVNTV